MQLESGYEATGLKCFILRAHLHTFLAFLFASTTSFPYLDGLLWQEDSKKSDGVG